LNRISKKFGFSSVEKELNVVSAVSNVFFGVDTKASSGTPVPPVSEELMDRLAVFVRVERLIFLCC
jgi:hypothetical protein